MIVLFIKYSDLAAKYVKLSADFSAIKVRGRRFIVRTHNNDCLKNKTSIVIQNEIHHYYLY